MRAFIVGTISDPPLSLPRFHTAELKPQKGEALALGEVNTTRLVTIEFNIELGQFLQKPLVCGFLKPPPPAVTVDQDHQVVGESGVLDIVVSSLSGGFLRPLQHFVNLIEVEIAEQRIWEPYDYGNLSPCGR